MALTVVCGGAGELPRGLQAVTDMEGTGEEGLAAPDSSTFTPLAPLALSFPAESAVSGAGGRSAGGAR